MRCPYCGDPLADTAWGVRGHLQNKHGVKRIVPVPPAPAAPSVTAPRRPARRPRGRARPPQWRPQRDP